MLVWRSPATAPTPTTREPPDARFSGTLCPKRQAHQTRELSQRTGHDRLIGPPRVWSTKQPLPLPMATRHSASARRRRPTFCSFRLEGAAGESRTALLLVPRCGSAHAAQRSWASSGCSGRGSACYSLPPPSPPAPRLSPVPPRYGPSEPPLNDGIQLAAPSMAGVA
jgi:hypothetical protein